MQETLQKIFSNKIVRAAILIALMNLLILFVISIFLRLYTHHGQKRDLPEIVGQNIVDAKNVIKKAGLKLVVEDSIFIIGKPGGEIIKQNPPPHSFVKQKRKVYVTVSKSNADEIKVAQLPTLYGKDYDRKKKELETGFSINSRIQGYEYDQGAPNQILKVMYKGKTIVSNQGRLDDVNIEKGGTLDFILSKNIGGEISMPNLECMTLEEARFLLESLQLQVGNVQPAADVTNQLSAVVYDQSPLPSEKLLTGDQVTVYITQKKPSTCN